MAELVAANADDARMAVAFIVVELRKMTRANAQHFIVDVLLLYFRVSLSEPRCTAIMQFFQARAYIRWVVVNFPIDRFSWIHSEKPGRNKLREIISLCEMSSDRLYCKWRIYVMKMVTRTVIILDAISKSTT